jgi:LacI family transcriptional regulator
MVTIKQVAQHAGVSGATVSRVLNHHPKVDPDLRDRVLASVAALNYQPSAVARSLRRQATRAIGLIVPDNRNAFFAEIARGIEAYCYGASYNVYLCNSADDEAKEIEYCHNLYQQRVAGIIMSITGTTAEGIRYLQDRGMPVVLIDRSSPEVEADNVQCNHYLGACRAMEYLIGLGHRHFGLVIGRPHHPPVRDRLRACIDVLRQHGEELNPALIYETQSYEFEAGYAGARCLLNVAGERPTAIFAFNDQMAIGVLRFALEHGIDVPEDLSIVGVDNIPIGSFVTPRLTTVAQPMADLGRTAAELLLDRIGGMSGGSIQRYLSTELIIRESTGPAKALSRGRHG